MCSSDLNETADYYDDARIEKQNQHLKERNQQLGADFLELWDDDQQLWDNYEKLGNEYAKLSVDYGRLRLQLDARDSEICSLKKQLDNYRSNQENCEWDGTPSAAKGYKRSRPNDH